MPYRDHTKKSDSVKHWTGLFLIESLFSLRRRRMVSPGLLAGAAHPRRQKHREMPPPGASAPAFAATVVPLLNRCRARPPPCKTSKARRVVNALWNACWGMGCFRASILDFRAKLANRCKLFPIYTLFRASILDFKPRLANRCKLFPVYALLCASILDFKARLANRCKVLPVYALQRAVILDFRSRLENHCMV